MNSRPAHLIYGRCVLAFVWFSLVASAFALTVIGANPQTDDPDVDKLVACWSSDRVTDSAGKCPVATKDTWQLCFSPTMGGWVQGSLTANHSEMLDNDKVAREDAVNCFSAGPPFVLTMLNYDVTVTRSPKNDLVLSETHHKCGSGDCSKALKTALNGKLTLEGDTLTFTRVDGSKIVFKRSEPNK
jgi:hypothetical protein